MRGGAGHAARQGAARNPRQLSRHRLFRPALSLDRAQGPHRGRLAQPARGKPSAVAQIRAGAGIGRRLVDQRPARQSRRADRLRRVGGARGGRVELERRAALFQKGRARHGFRRAVARQGRPHPGPPHLSRYVERPRQGGRESVRGGRVPLHPGPERRVQGRLFPDHDLEPLRPARLGGDRLSRSGHAAARQSDDLGRDPGQASCCSRARAASASRRWSTARRPSSASASQRARSSSRRGRSIRRRICCAPGSGRPGICAISASRSSPMCRGSASG